MKAFAWTRMSVAAVLISTGCAHRGNLDLLEGRLRQQEDEIVELQTELETTRTDLGAVRREADSLRTQLTSQGDSPLLPEQAQVLYRTTGVRFNKLLTSGLDEDGEPGDELLHAVLQPHDQAGELLKVPGTIELTVTDPALPAGSQQIGAWRIEAEESAACWHRGFIGSGYQFKFPWQQPPAGPELVLHTRFTTPDGRQFTASQMIQVDPPVSLASAVEAEEETSVAPVPLPQEPQPFPEGPSRREIFFRPVPEAPSVAPRGQDLTGASEPRPANEGVRQTSDNWTDATLPTYR